MRKLKAGFLFSIFSLMICCFLPSMAMGSSLAGLVEKGNRLFNRQKFDEALKRYEEARLKAPDSAVVNFNKGAALYKKGDYEKAADSFLKALNTEKAALEAKANYNLGNSRYKQAAFKAQKDLSAAVDLCKEALNYYARAIELDERDKDIKYNYEFVEKELQELLKKQKQQEKQQQKKDEQQQKEEQQQEKRGGQQQNSQPREEKQTETAKQKEEQKKDNQEDSEKQPREKQSGEEESSAREEEGKSGDKEQPGAKEEPRQMSKEEARMLLEGCRQEELQGELKDKEPVKAYPDVLKDW